jgi:hypothetical protein
VGVEQEEKELKAAELREKDKDCIGAERVKGKKKNGVGRRGNSLCLS